MTGPDPSANADLAALAGRAGSLLRFADGDGIRVKGQFYRDMLLILEGRAEVRFEPSGPASRLLTIGAGDPIGEIGFLNGCAATASVTARGPLVAWQLDDAAVSQLEAADPEAAVRLLRAVADISARRQADNGAFTAAGFRTRSPSVEILLCRTEAMLTSAQELRYAVYCDELGRTSPHADHDRKIIADALDDFGHVFVARAEGRTVGTIRANRPSEGDIGLYEELYGMRASPHFPGGVAISTKFALRKEVRGGPIALKLIAALASFALQYDVRECYCDCVPGLIHYYRAMGFEPCGPPFLHRENGTSYPMRMDVRRHRRRLGRDPGLVELTAFLLRSRLAKWRARLSPPQGGQARGVRPT